MIRFGAIVEARMTSKRLPGKILYKADETFFVAFNTKIKESKTNQKIIIATTINKSDDILVSFAKKNKINYYRGSELNVKKRVFEASKNLKYKILLVLQVIVL